MYKQQTERISLDFKTQGIKLAYLEPCGFKSWPDLNEREMGKSRMYTAKVWKYLRCLANKNWDVPSVTMETPLFTIFPNYKSLFIEIYRGFPVFLHILPWFFPMILGNFHPHLRLRRLPLRHAGRRAGETVGVRRDHSGGLGTRQGWRFASEEIVILWWQISNFGINDFWSTWDRFYLACQFRSSELI